MDLDVSKSKRRLGGRTRESRGALIAFVWPFFLTTNKLNPLDSDFSLGALRKKLDCFASIIHPRFDFPHRLVYVKN